MSINILKSYLTGFGFILLSLSYHSHATVIVYNAPESIEASDLFEVSILQGNNEYNAFTYITRSTIPTKPDLASSFLNFDMVDKVTVKIRLLQNIQIDHVTIRPLSKTIQPAIENNYIVFDLDHPAQLSVEINQSTDHTLLVFANPIEENPPKSTDQSVVWFGPGIHDVGDFTMPDGKDHIYIHGEAYVKGRFDLRKDATISGRGIVSGEEYIYETNIFRSLVNTRRVEGITILNTPHYNLQCTYGNWVKAISWYGQTDGVHINENGTIENCFFKVNDDVYKLYNSGIRVRNCVVWLLYTGAPFQLTWNLMGKARKDIKVSDIDIIHTQYEVEHINRAIINSVHGGNADIDGVVFDRIRVEGDTWRIMMLALRRTRYGNATTLGNISNILVKNMTVTGEVLHPGRLSGIYEDGKVSSVTGIRFENLFVNGEKIIDKHGAKGWVIDHETSEYPSFK